ncbi:MAG: hypothetical protein ACJ74O_01610 [Frankiaceae bacterium]
MSGNFRARFPQYRTAQEQARLDADSAAAREDTQRTRYDAVIGESLRTLRDAVRVLPESDVPVAAVELPARLLRPGRTTAGWVFGEYTFPSGNEARPTGSGPWHYAITEEGLVVGGRRECRGEMFAVVVTNSYRHAKTAMQLLDHQEEHFRSKGFPKRYYGDSGLTSLLLSPQEIKAALRML